MVEEEPVHEHVVERGQLGARQDRGRGPTPSATAITKATNDVFGFWTGAMTSAASPKRKRKR